MPDRKKLQGALERLKTCKVPPLTREDETFTNPDGSKFRRVNFRGENEADAHILFGNLPAIAEDVLRHGDLIAHLVSTIAQQQKQINDLHSRFEALVSALVGVRCQENMHDLIRGLAEMGSDVEEPEVRVTMTGTLKAQSTQAQKQKESGGSNTSATTSVEVGVKGLAKLLAGLNAEVDLNETGVSSSLRQLDSSASSMLEESRTAHIEIRFKSVKGNPIVQATADAIRAGRATPELAARASSDDPPTAQQGNAAGRASRGG